MRNPALFALPLFVALSACNEAREPAAEPTTEGPDIAMRSTPIPGVDPTMQSPLGPQAAGATEAAGPAAHSADECGAAKAQTYKNALPSSDVLKAIRAAIGHDRIRVINPGDVITMDLRPDRLNLETGVDGRIKTLRCG